MRVSIWLRGRGRLLIAVTTLRGWWTIAVRSAGELTFAMNSLEASCPTGSSLAGANTAVVVVDLHIPPGSQDHLDIPTCLSGVDYSEEGREREERVFVIGLTPRRSRG
jgi:hypothetical protein